MPKAEIPVGFAKVTAQGTFGPASWANVFYMGITLGDGKTPGDGCADAAQAVSELWSDCDLGNFSSDFEVHTINVFYRDSEDSITRIRVATAIVGTNDGDEESAQVAYLINWSTTDPRRGGKARQYLVGVPQDRMQDSARLTSSAITGITAGLLTWLTDLADNTHWDQGSTLELVEMSFVDGKADRVTPIAYPIQLGTLNPVVATQRRRVDRLRV